VKILGLSAYHQDAAAALVVDGEPVAAAQEGLYTKTPLDASLPLKAARSCLDRAGLKGPELDRVIFYEKPLRRFERTLATGLRSFPRGGRGFARELSRWLGDRLWIKGELIEELGVDASQVVFLEHALSHAACAFYLSPFEEAAALVLDDAGEWSTCAIAHGVGSDLSMVGEIHLPHSLGLAASAFTQFLGFDPGADDPWLADLAAHGTPRFREQVQGLIGEGDDGAPRLDLDAFQFGEGARSLTTERFSELFGPGRTPGEPLRWTEEDPRDVDLAASVQVVLEERALALAARARLRTDAPNLVVAGVLARNRGVVTALHLRSEFEQVFVPPEPSDAGGALGAALFLHYAEGGARVAPGAALALGEVLGAYSEREADVTEVGYEALLEDLVAGRPVGWARGALEFAGESLGARCVLGDPRPADARGRLLAALQRSEEFLGCRLALCAEDAERWCALPRERDVALALGQLVLPASDALRAVAPGAVMPDGTVWVQTVAADGDPDLHALLKLFVERTGAPGLLLDTLRLRGAVIPRFDHEALEVLDRSQLAALLAGDRLYRAKADEVGG
jgi:carbamoyltransferase